MPTSRSQFDEHRVHAFEALKRDGQKNALELLHRIAEQVRPIMQKRGWRVGLLKGAHYVYVVLYWFPWSGFVGAR
jgi:hypothetical protein